MIFDEKTQLLVKYSDPVITSLGKSKILDQSQQQKKFKKNAIVMGDMVDDIFMTKRMECETKLNIGFYNIDKQEVLEDLKNHFDIIVINDGNLTLLECILKYIKGNINEDFFDKNKQMNKIKSYFTEK